MPRLIDADTFKVNMERKYGFYARQPQDDIDAQPTVDAVPVVRCKDCKYWILGRITDHDDFIPPSCKVKAGIWSAYSFCSYGERKDGDHDDYSEW